MQGVSRVFAVSVWLFICALGLPLQAQNAGVAGNVIDQAGKVVEGAKLTVKNDAASVDVVTDDAGHFSATGLANGTYTIQTTAPGFALNTRLGVQVPSPESQDLSITLNVDAVSQSVTVQDTILLAVESAPMGNTLDADSARTEISTAVIQNFMAPVADFAEVIEQAPGAFSINPNGIGLGQGKSYFRGFKDGNYSITFDGIPFEDTNDPTHHSWASFPSQWISSTDFNRSPGRVYEFGPSNFGGSVNLKSPELQADPDIRGTMTYASFNTHLYSLDFESGLLGPRKQDSVLFNINAMDSDGYQTYNYQQRDAGYGKYQHRFSSTSSLTLYGGVVDIWNNTPDTTNPTRAAVAAHGLNYLMDGNPCLDASGNSVACSATSVGYDPYYYGYEHYHVQTDFEYFGYNADLGGGWKLDNKAYTTRYWNKQFLVNSFVMNTSTNKPSGVDKLNGYRHAGDTLVVSKEFKYGVLRTGTWYDWAYTDRYQYPSNPVTQSDTPFPKFHEKFITHSFHPFVEFEWHATPRLVIAAGVKDGHYTMNLKQYQDVSTVQCLGGTLTTYPSTAGIWANAPRCIGGAAFVSHGINYNSWLPNLSIRYRLQSAWSVYGQFAEGNTIPPSNVFDVPGGLVATPPNPTLAKTYQVGSVLKRNRWTLDVDAYYVHFQNPYSSYYDQNAAETVFYQTGPSNTKGVEAEGNIALGYGLSLYANATFGNAKYQEGKGIANGGLWVANTPGNVEGTSLLYQHRNWDVGFTYKRVGQMYNDNKTANEAIIINPFDLENFFFNYTIKNSSRFRGTKIQFAANNLADHHSILGISPANGPTATSAYTQAPGDLLVLMPGRSFSITVTGGYAPRR